MLASEPWNRKEMAKKKTKKKSEKRKANLFVLKLIWIHESGLNKLKAQEERKKITAKLAKIWNDRKKKKINKEKKRRAK